ncbi:hypothetical protein C8R44DRAFT_883643 [Mycena epipterygia]|nr:hypothetical protein C8R44DRAFT_883643 [Mycena epipterygia]
MDTTPLGHREDGEGECERSSSWIAVSPSFLNHATSLALLYLLTLCTTPTLIPRASLRPRLSTLLSTPSPSPKALDASPKDLTRALPGYPTLATLIQASQHHPKHSPRRRPFHKVQRAQERITLDPFFFPSSWPLPLCPALRSHLRLHLRLLLRLFLCGSAVSMYHHFKRKYDDAASDSPSRKTGPAAKESRRVVVVANHSLPGCSPRLSPAIPTSPVGYKTRVRPKSASSRAFLPTTRVASFIFVNRLKATPPRFGRTSPTPLFTVYGTWHDKCGESLRKLFLLCPLLLSLPLSVFPTLSSPLPPRHRRYSPTPPSSAHHCVLTCTLPFVFIHASPPPLTLPFRPSRYLVILQGFFDALYKLSDVAVAVLSWYCLLGAAYVG